jgi:ribosomal protein S18 acetylase RimI-like enzyme
MLALSALPPADRPRHIAAWNGALQSGQATLWIGQRERRIVAAMLAEVQPGRTAVVGCPQTLPGQPPEVAGAVLTYVIEQLRQGGVTLVQAVPPTHATTHAEQFVAAGLQPACELLYLVSVSADFPADCPDVGLELIPYESSRHDRLVHVIERTYEGSLDCPQFATGRSLEDVVAGYRAVGEFDPARWLIVRQTGADVGCLLLADHPDNNACELVYMGAIPEARGRGLGVALVRHAQWLTAQAGRERLSAAVDADNSPAIAAYAAAGFTGWDRRTVFLRSFT